MARKPYLTQRVQIEEGLRDFEIGEIHAIDDSYEDMVLFERSNDTRPPRVIQCDGNGLKYRRKYKI